MKRVKSIGAVPEKTTMAWAALCNTVLDRNDGLVAFNLPYALKPYRLIQHVWILTNFRLRAVV